VLVIGKLNRKGSEVSWLEAWLKSLWRYIMNLSTKVKIIAGIVTGIGVIGTPVTLGINWYADKQVEEYKSEQKEQDIGQQIDEMAFAIENTQSMMIDVSKGFYHLERRFDTLSMAVGAIGREVVDEIANDSTLSRKEFLRHMNGLWHFWEELEDELIYIGPRETNPHFEPESPRNYGGDPVAIPLDTIQ